MFKKITQNNNNGVSRIFKALIYNPLFNANFWALFHCLHFHFYLQIFALDLSGNASRQPTKTGRPNTFFKSIIIQNRKKHK